MQNGSIADYATGALFPTVYRCAREHVHQGTLSLRWFYSEPITVFAISNEREEFMFSRDVLRDALRVGSSAGYPVVGQGNVTFKVLRENKTMISIHFNGGKELIADRDQLIAWVQGTYVHVPDETKECAIMDMDAVIKQLLSAK